MSSSWSIPGHNLDLELGPVFLAHCFNWSLYGLLCLQVFMYYASFPKDQRHCKVLVYTVFIIDTISIALSTFSGYWVFVTNWGNTHVFHHLGWSWSTVPASSGLVALIVQTYFAHRIWVISNRRWYMPVFIVLLSATACAFAFAAAAEVARLQSFTYIRHLMPSIWLSFGIAADFFVCSTLCYYLLSNRGGFACTNRIILRLVKLSIETALVTMVAAGIKLYLIFSRHDNMHLLFCLLLSRLYTNAMLGTLNARMELFGGTHGFESVRRSGGSARVFSVGEGTSFGSIKRGMSFAKSPVVYTRSVETDYEAALRSPAKSDDGQELIYSPMVPTYPISPMPPSYNTSRAASVRSVESSTPILERPTRPSFD